MQSLEVTPGSTVRYQNHVYQVQSALDLEKVLLVEPEGGQTLVAELHLLEPVASKDEVVVCTQDLSTISDGAWQLAKQRAQVLGPLAKKAVCSCEEIKEASQLLKLKRRQIYNLLYQYRASGCQLRALVPQKTSGGSGKARLSTEIEQMIHAVIKSRYLKPQKIKMSVVIEEIRRLCFQANLTPPAASTIRRRLAKCYTDLEIVAKREGAQKAKAQFSPLMGSFPEQKHPLAVYQIDHTLVDLVVVDELYRTPIGRPYITVAIDVYSRCIAGFCLTLEPPSAVSVGLCLTQAVLDKNDWLADRDIEAEWPIWGKPERLYVDNAKEFHSEALRRGCEAHGIQIQYRPVGQPHYGGIVERLIGTLMQLIHQLPGTTFSNIQEKGDYDPEKTAVLTLSELEKWIAIAITQYYHLKLHEGILMPPLKKYQAGILGDKTHPGRGYPAKICHKKAFLVDFLPIEHRSLQRSGFTLDRITYYSNALSTFMADRKQPGKFLIRRDPRDLSRIYVVDPKSQGYIEVPYRTLMRPSVSLWEHRQALKYLRDRGVAQVEESQLFQAIEKLRELAKKASLKSKKARRQVARQPSTPPRENKGNGDIKTEDYQQVEPFKDLEIW